MISGEGWVKILDFGLVKLADSPGDDDATVVASDDATQEGRILGTVAYMSPEQAEGKAVDRRTDIFSLGVVLYEMLSGCRPFTGDTTMSLIASILRDPPPPIVDKVAGIPEELVAIIHRCLEKDPAARYQSTAELKGALDALAGRFVSGDHTSTLSSAVSRGSAPAKRPARRGAIGVAAGVLAVAVIAIVLYRFVDFGSVEAEAGERTPVAVVDFVNETGEKELDGLSGMLITALEQSRRLSVLTRSRMLDEAELLGYAGVERIDETLGREICRSADVQALVIASVRRFGALYSVDFKVLDPGRNEYIFTASEEGKGQESIPGMIDKLAEATRRELKEQVASIRTASRGVAEMTTVDMEAYQHYFKGEELIHAKEFDGAIEEFRQAVAIDSMFALAWFRLAYSIGWSDEKMAAEPLARAVKLIDRIPEKEQYLVRAEVARVDSGFEHGVAVLREMQQHYPDDREMIFLIGDWLYHAGEIDSSMVYLKKVLDVDPTHMRAIDHLVLAANRLGDPEEARCAAEKLIETEPSVQAYAFHADACRKMGDLEAAEASVEKGRTLDPYNESIILTMVNNWYAREDFDAVEEFCRSLSEVEDREGVSYARFADAVLFKLYAERGRFDDLFGLTEAAVKRERAAGETIIEAAYIANDAMLHALYRNDWNRAKGALRTIEAMNIETDSRNYWDKMYKLYVIDGQTARAHEIVDEHLGGSPGMHKSVDIFARFAAHDCDGTDSLLATVTDQGAPQQTAPAHFEIARCMIKSGRYERARWHLDRVLAGYEDSPFRVFVYGWAQYLLGIVCEETGSPDEAMEHYERFLVRWKDADDGFPQLADARARLAALKRS